MGKKAVGPEEVGRAPSMGQQWPRPAEPLVLRGHGNCLLGPFLFKIHLSAAVLIVAH